MTWPRRPSGLPSMIEVELVLTDHRRTQGSIDVAGTSPVEIDLDDPGIVVLDHEGHVVATNARARELLRADSVSALNERLAGIQNHLPGGDGGSDERSVDVPGIGALSVRSSVVGGVGGDGRVLLVRDSRSVAGERQLLQHAARHRSFAFLARDWAHDLKGMLHVIRINGALLGRLVQRQPATPDSAITKCLDAIPREVERLDRSIELVFGTRSAESRSRFDVGRMCERLRDLVAARAMRQRVDVVLEVIGGSKEVAGFEDQVQCAIMNVIVNALEAMPERGQLVITASGSAAAVTVRVCDSGAGIPPQPNGRLWRPHFVNDQRQTGIGLHVARAIVESHRGRIECASNVPHGTCIEITLPAAASTGF
jgi:signal transduction histidine kinase